MSSLRPSQSFNVAAAESNFKGKQAYKTIGVSSGITALGWSVTVADNYPLLNRKKKTKKMAPMLTIYVTTPSKSLTLLRSRQELYDLNEKLQSDLPGRLPKISTALLLPAPPKKRTVLATLRTFNPKRTLPAISRSAKADLDLSEVSNYLSNASMDSKVLIHPSWTTFFNVGKDDLESIRTERRIQRTKSDITTLLSPGGMMSLDEIPSFDSLKREATGSITESMVAIRPPTPSTASSPIRSSPSNSSNDISSEATNAFSDLYPPTLNKFASSTDMTDLTEENEVESDDVEEKVIRSNRKQRITIESFEMMRVLGKGCAGKVLLVRHRETKDLFALKAIHKTHVLAHRELQHTITEQQVLRRCSQDQSNPFVVRLHYSFHDSEILYLALDFHNGGDLATQLARWGRLGRDRARFYCAEIVEGVEGLHRAGVIYRDLKPENILISSEGHCVLTDFGLSKDFGHSKMQNSNAQLGSNARPHWLGAPGMRSSSAPAAPWISPKRETTSTFCGTAEYLAPEVLLGEPYSYEVDAWSCGTLLYEMLAGVTPFWSESHADMYHKVLHDPLSFSDVDERVFDDDTKNLLRGMLQKDPLLRMTDERIKKHPYFQMIDWGHIFARRYVAPFVPTINPLDDSDTQNFDETFLTMAPAIGEDGEGNVSEIEAPEGDPQEPFDENGNDVFDGYSFFGHGDGDSIRESESIDIGSTLEENEVDVVLQDGVPSVDDTSSSTQTDSTPSHSANLDELTSSLSVSRQPYSQTLESVTEIPMLVEDFSEEEGWDVVETDVGGEAKNGGKGTLWSRGIKDKFSLRLAPSPKLPSSSSEIPVSRIIPPLSSVSSIGSLTPRPTLLRMGSTGSGKVGPKARLSDRSLPGSTIDLTNSVESIDSTNRNSSSPSSTSKSKGSVLKRALSFRPNGNKPTLS